MVETTTDTRTGGGLAVASLTLGIIGALVGIIPLLFVLAWILGALAVAFGAIARRGGARRAMATWGLVLGLVAIALGVAGVVIVDDAFDDLGDDLRELDEEFDTPA